MPNESPKVNVFISYAHEDEKYCLQLKDCLHENFCPDVTVWTDGKILLGNSWDATIKKHLEESKIVLLLISRDFLLSRYIESVELKSALERHERKQCRVIPVFTRACLLNNFPQIKALQGFPRDMQALAGREGEIDELYMEFQQEINDIAKTELNILEAKNHDGNGSDKANALDELRAKRKIFLSVPDLAEAREKREELVMQAEGKQKHFNWPYEMVPGIAEVLEMDKMGQEEREKRLAALLSESVYSIHIFSSENDLKEGNGKIQYDLAKGQHPVSVQAVFKSIVWPLSNELRDKIDTEIAKNNSVIADGFGALFSEIGRFDKSKAETITALERRFSPNQKVYMYYDFSADHDNELRITLKDELEKKYVFRYNSPDDDLQKEKEDLAECDGAVVFYGAAAPRWFAVKQDKVLAAKHLRSRGVCVDEPDIATKCKRDVIKHDFVTIQGKENLAIGLTDFVAHLNNQP